MTSAFNGLFDGVGSILALLLLPKLGAYSDVHGRKPVLMLSLASCCLPLWLLCISETWNPDLLWLFYSGRVFGSIPAMGFCFSYVSDICTPSLRARHFGYIMWGLFLGVLMGPGLYLALPGEMSFYVVSVIGVLGLFYVHYLVPESLNSDTEFLIPTEDMSDGLNSNNIKLDDTDASPSEPEGTKLVDLKGVAEENVPLTQAFTYLFGNATRLPIAVVYLFSSFTTRGVTDIWGIYLKNNLDFADNDLGIFTIGVGLSGGLGLGLMYPLMVKFMGPVSVLRVSLFSNVAGNCLIVFVQQKREINIIYVFLVFQYMVLPICNTLLCSQIPESEYGMALGSLSGIGQFSNAAGPALLSALYSVFSSDKVGINYPKAIFITGAGLAFIALACSLLLPKKLNETKHTTIVSNPDPE